MDDSCTRVVLADDDVLLREGLASLLDRSGLEVVGQVGDAEELIEVVRQQQPELAVVDIRMPPIRPPALWAASTAARGCCSGPLAPATAKPP